MVQTSTVPLTPCEIHLDPPIRTKLERERQAFQRLLPELKAKYAGQFVAIHDGQVADTGPNRLEVAMRVLERVGNVDLFVGFVGDEPPAMSRTGLRRDLKSIA